jgi:Ser/Thr protein kinase RdoA (MazF antagonist)
MKNQIISNHFIKRIGFSQDQLKQALEQISISFSLGSISSTHGIEEGYEDVNIKITTTKGHYLCKFLVNFITKKSRTLKEAQYYAYVIEQLAKGGLRVPNLLSTTAGSKLYKISIKNLNPIHVLVMEFFEGKHFLEIAPTIKDMQNITLILKQLHSLDFPLQDHICDDPWQPQFLHKYYKKHANILPPKEKLILKKTVQKLKLLDLNKYKKTPTHGDIMRNNILKNSKGEYCLLDFGVIANNYWIIDLALFLAGFCLDPKLNIKTNQKILNKVINTYLKHRKIKKEITDDLNLLITASYSAFYLAATLEKIMENNFSDENMYWINLGREGMQMMKSIENYTISPNTSSNFKKPAEAFRCPPFLISLKSAPSFSAINFVCSTGT